MHKNSLSLSFALIELSRHGLPKKEAAEILSEASHQLDKTLKRIVSDGMSNEQIAVLRAMLMRLILADPKNRTDDFCDGLVAELKAVSFTSGHEDMFPIELQITMAARASNKYTDFVYLLMLTESLSYETFSRLSQVGTKEIKRTIALCLSVYEKVGGGAVSLFLFSSLLEDALSTTLNPVLDSIAADTRLRQQFILEPNQLLVGIASATAEKIKNSLYLSDALIKSSGI